MTLRSAWLFGQQVVAAVLSLKQNKWRKEIGSGVKLTFDSYFFIFFRGRVLSRQKERGVPTTLSSLFFFFCARSSAGVFYAFACCPTFLSRLRVLSEQRGARKPTTAFFCRERHGGMGRISP